jgi:hypothetical protein
VKLLRRCGQGEDLRPRQLQLRRCVSSCPRTSTQNLWKRDKESFAGVGRKALESRLHDYRA